MLDERDKDMMAISVPVVDYWEMRDDLDRLEDAVLRLEKVVEALIELHRNERVKNWELILREMIRGHQNGNRTLGGQQHKVADHERSL